MVGSNCRDHARRQRPTMPGGKLGNERGLMIHKVVEDVGNGRGNMNPFVYRQITSRPAIQGPARSGRFGILGTHFENIGVNRSAARSRPSPIVSRSTVGIFQPHDERRAQHHPMAFLKAAHPWPATLAPRLARWGRPNSPTIVALRFEG